jgi:hypothetical protein
MLVIADSSPLIVLVNIAAKKMLDLQDAFERLQKDSGEIRAGGR